MKKFLSILLAVLVCLTAAACGDRTGTPPDPSYSGGSQTDADKETDKETDGETEREEDQGKDEESEDETEKPSGGTVVTPIQPGGDYNVGSGYGK